MSVLDWLTVLAVVLCLLISAFFSASETALAASSRAAMMRNSVPDGKARSQI